MGDLAESRGKEFQEGILQMATQEYLDWELSMDGVSPPDSQETDGMLSPESRPRAVTCINVPGEVSPRQSLRRSKSVRCRNQSGVICHTRSNSVVSRNGKRICKNLGRINSLDYHESSPEFQNTVRLFRLNSFVKDRGQKEDVDAEPERQQWDDPMEFLMSCISMSVGLGNVWRFPFTAYENGGGAFLIPYLIVLLMIGRPMFLLELAVGQFSSSGCVKMWDLAPAFRGIGYGQVIASFIVCSYYCVLIGISFYFLFSSMQSVLPWTVCHPDLADNSTICLPSGQNRSDLNITNDSIPIISSTEQFFSKGVLKENGDISGGIGSPDPALLGCLVLCWFLIYLTLRKGVSSSGKVAYFTAIFPYLVMFTLLIRGLLLPGAIDGIIFLFTPKWEKLLELKVWYAAVTQSFFSLSIGFGSVITFSSYNKFNHNIYRDATIISFMDTMTSMLAGVITFAILGYLSHELGVPIDQTVKSGGGLAFISYPEVVSKFEFCPQLFAILFFLMLITLGMGSAVGLVNVITTVVQETFPNLSQSFVSGLVCVTGLLAGIAYTTPGGQPLLELIDYYGGSMMVLLMAVTWLLVLICVYGIRKLLSDIKFMMNKAW